MLQHLVGGPVGDQAAEVLFAAEIPAEDEPLAGDFVYLEGKNDAFVGRDFQLAGNEDVGLDGGPILEIDGVGIEAGDIGIMLARHHFEDAGKFQVLPQGFIDHAVDLALLRRGFA